LLTVRQELLPSSTTRLTAPQEGVFETALQQGPKAPQIMEDVSINSKEVRMEEGTADNVDEREADIERWRGILMGQKFVLRKPPRNSVDVKPKDPSVCQLSF